MAKRNNHSRRQRNRKQQQPQAIPSHLESLLTQFQREVSDAHQLANEQAGGLPHVAETLLDLRRVQKLIDDNPPLRTYLMRTYERTKAQEAAVTGGGGLYTRAASTSPSDLSGPPSQAKMPSAGVAGSGQTQMYAKRQPVGVPQADQLRAWADANPWIRTAINIRKNQISTADLVVEPLDKNASFDKNALQTVQQILDTPNEYGESMRTILARVEEDLQVLDRGVIEKGMTASRKPYALYSSDGAKIKIYPGWSGNPNEPRYLYEDSSIGYRIGLRNDEAIVMHMNEASYRYGLSNVAVLRKEILADIAATEGAMAAVKGHPPSSIIQIPKESDTGIRKIRNTYDLEVAGQREILFLGGEEPVHVYPLMFSAKDNQWMEWQEWLAKKIAAIFGISAQRFNITTGTNRATAQVQQAFDEDAGLVPMLLVVEEFLNREFLYDFAPLTSDGRPNIRALNLAIRFPMVSDAARLMHYERTVELAAKAAPGNPLLTPNDILSMLGKPPVPHGGDTFWMVSNGASAPFLSYDPAFDPMQQYEHAVAQNAAQTRSAEAGATMTEIGAKTAQDNYANKDQNPNPPATGTGNNGGSGDNGGGTSNQADKATPKTGQPSNEQTGKAKGVSNHLTVDNRAPGKLWTPSVQKAAQPTATVQTDVQEPVQSQTDKIINRLAQLRKQHGLKEWNEDDHPRDNHGRFAGGDGGGGSDSSSSSSGSAASKDVALSNTAAQALEDAVNRDGGFSYRVLDGSSPKDGYMVSRWPERSVAEDKAQLHPADLQAFVQHNADLLGQPDKYLGGWLDNETGKVYLDISQRADSQAAAESLCRNFGQRAYYGIKEGSEFRVLSEAEAHQAKGFRYGRQQPDREAQAGTDGRGENRPQEFLNGRRDSAVGKTDGAEIHGGQNDWETPRRGKRKRRTIDVDADPDSPGKALGAGSPVYSAASPLPAILAEWEEDLHPRDSHGRFAGGDGGGDTSAEGPNGHSGTEVSPGMEQENLWPNKALPPGKTYTPINGSTAKDISYAVYTNVSHDAQAAADAAYQNFGNDLEANQEGAIAQFASRDGFSSESDYVSAVDKQLTDDLGQCKVFSRVPTNVVDNILDDGRMKSQFESGSSSGLLNNEFRSNAEATLMDVPQDVSESERPIYCYASKDGEGGLGGGGLVEQYGSTAIELKDTVKDRSTVMIGDTLDDSGYDDNQYAPKSGGNVDEDTSYLFGGYGGGPQARPTPFTKPNIDAIPTQLDGMGLVFNKNGTLTDTKSDSYYGGKANYAEVQVHGGVTVNDIAAVHFLYNPTQITADKLNELKIPYTVKHPA